ncbi:MAG: hypothetical protein K8U03_25110 [Planctomycetia bacterium]|nr:hypothetical protein [Planctomycetia bacterium]
MNALFTLLLMLPTAPAADRPAWVDAPAGLRDGVYETQTIVGPESTREECEKQVLPAVRSAVQEYLERLNEATAGGSVPTAVELKDEDLARRIIGERWEERVRVDGADRIFLHVQLKFDAHLQAEWVRIAQAYTSQVRGWKLTAAFLLAIWGLAIVHVGLRVDDLLAGRSSRAALWLAAAALATVPFFVAG